MTSQAWRGWEQVRGPICPFAVGGKKGLLLTQLPMARLGRVMLTVPLLSPDITVICPWEAFSHLELHELAQYGII